MMNKKLISLAIAGAFASASPAIFAAEAMSASVSGYVDTIFVVDAEGADDTALDVDGAAANPANQKFTTTGEIDFVGSVGDVSARIDFDVTDGATDVEQAFIGWAANDAVAVNIGQPNSGVGFEAEDAPDLYQITNGQIQSVIAGQSSEGPGNNIEGVVLAFNAGPATIRVGLLDDLHGANEENSLLLSAGGAPMEGLGLAFGGHDLGDSPRSMWRALGKVVADRGPYSQDKWW